MNRVASRLRIGEKIGIGFGVVLIVFLGIVWHDQSVLRSSLADYRYLTEVVGARQTHAFAIESRLARMRGAADRFLMNPDPRLPDAVRAEADAMTAAIDGLARVDSVDRRTVDRLGSLTQEFLNRFSAIETAWRRKGLDENAGLQGAFRASAHELEERVARELPALQTQVLQLRRREKDYLLRGGEGYVQMVEGILAVLTLSIDASPLGSEERAHLSALVRDYGRNFSALVEQDRLIGELTEAMNQAAERVTPLVEDTLAEANALMERSSAELAKTSVERARLALSIAIAATLFGVIFAMLLTYRIVRPVRLMVELLDRLTHENPSERVAVPADPRDEIMAMAISVNTLADHKSTFDRWWRDAMREAIALRDAQVAGSEVERDEAAKELREALAGKVETLRVLQGQLSRECARMLEASARLEGRHAGHDQDIQALRRAAETLRELLEVLDVA
ncbi:histidine kinase HAMP region domain protein [Thiorhodococcus drewsii AZ1]|uniref:Histidine kinase HAMP region domain protein n=1 Tax=Thiorhodococcus drewsii AZ1 TaxID=765913 RepID=G2E709_9GAMM|nr:HAMP domain-containing protein [Thiorhodococcus drewsii]EGV28109.1 histidine kinase HAMP region domain protein [Thiorhodococcus drewsii AZ1]